MSSANGAPVRARVLKHADIFDEMAEIRRTMATKDDIHRLGTAIDALVAEVHALRDMIAVHAHRLDELEKRCPPARES